MAPLPLPGRTVAGADPGVVEPLPITRDTLDAMLRAGGYLPMMSHDRVVIATRPIAGHDYETREVVFHRLDAGRQWIGALFLRQLGYHNNVMPPLHQSASLADVDAAEMWLAGVTSKPIDEAEVVALKGGA